MNSAEQIAASLRASYKKDLLTAMEGPLQHLAERVEVCYVPPRESDGWFDGRRLLDYQVTEASVLRAVLPDARLEDVQVITRADDQIIVVMTLKGTLAGGRAFAASTTMIYDVRDDRIVRITGHYDASKLAAFSEAFSEAATSADVPITMTKERPRSAV